MKRFFAFILLLAMVFSLVACGSSSGNKHALGETVSTDIAELTVYDAKFAYYLCSLRSTSGPSKNYITPYMDKNERGTDTFFTAATGHSYVWLSFDLKNIDRGNSMSFGGSFNDWKWAIKYAGKEYKLNGYDLLDKSSGSGGLNMAYAAVDNAGHSSGNILLFAGEKASVRAFGIVGVDPSSLNDGFDLIIKLPNSSGKYETFVYIVG